MATDSTVPAVKTALVTLITAGLSGVQVKYGRPADSQLEAECVYVAEAVGSHRIPVFKGTGRKPREERYSVEIVVAALQQRGEITDAETRAFVLLAAVEDVVANDPTLGGVDGLIHAIAGDWETAAEQTVAGPAAIIRFNVDCLARLS